MRGWCANRLRVTGLAENVSQVRALMTGEVRLSYEQAEAFVENRHERNVYCADYPCAHAFSRLLRGSRRVWLAAIDRMIASAGEDCPHLLNSYDVHDLFPGWQFQGT